MEETRENKLAELRKKNIAKEELVQRNNDLGRELNELENEALVK